MKDEYVLGIESSCDETAFAILKNGKELLSNTISTQIKTHMQYGGVMPEIASRLHLENIGYVFLQTLKEANINVEDISLVAVTYGPGLIGGLHVGVIAAKTIAAFLNVPIVKVHHLAGHIYANTYVGDFKFPLIAVLASGGNSEIIYMDKDLSYKIIGETLDDAIGEGLDKIARCLQLPYPGGVSIDKLTKDKDITPIKLPNVRVSSYNLSYSGLKSHVIKEIDKIKEKGQFNEKVQLQYAYSVEKAFVDQLLKKVMKASEDYKVKQIVIGGGVSANSYLRKRIYEIAKDKFEVLIPPLWCTTDNAAMIAKVGYLMYKKGIVSDLQFPCEASSELEKRC